ncbi:MAG: type II toxin-antitoxin system death-on-curing family toxin [Anaerolineae bacterium]|nr:type II toxin-antitoxin system death-on-curing family toxin [Anaerolineae bacterium]
MRAPKNPTWLLREVVLAVHEQLIAQFGGGTGLRDAGLLDSALARPRHLAAYSEPTLPELAASYAFGLVKNHPFIDGNKRIGFVAATLFLELNGMRFQATEADAVIQTLALATGDVVEAAYAAWLDENSMSTDERSSVYPLTVR